MLVSYIGYNDYVIVKSKFEKEELRTFNLIPNKNVFPEIKVKDERIKYKVNGNTTTKI